ncbi:MAG: hypothetical protein BAJATHORv1_30169 [Candidatus Thorarchaeota archaeon]|nr:MAG: hypothetical protein BAJATHORv1_30169 [Candidatus Thorarchaeota archaeon]
MGRVSLYLQKSDGTRETVHIYSNQTVLDLSSQQIESIDLSGLASNYNIREILLSNNDLSTLDIGALKYCSSLEKLDLSGNQLKAINLDPLKYIGSLRILRLNRNQLKVLDLRALQNCHNLRELIISSNKIRQLDLAPLYEHGELQLLDLGNNSLTDIELEPLLTCHSLRDVSLGENKFHSVDISRFLIHELDTEFTGIRKRALEVIDRKMFQERDIQFDVRWDRSDLQRPSIHQDFRQAIKKFAIFNPEYSEYYKSSQFPKDNRILHASALILRSYGLGYFIGYEGDIVNYLNNLPSSLSAEQIRRELQLFLLEEVGTQIDNNGLTVLFDIEEMANDCGDCVFLVEKIIQRRKEEIEETVLLHNGKTINVRPLYFTAYGHHILKKLDRDQRRTMRLSEFKTIRYAFRELDIHIRTTTNPSQAQFLVKVSNQMATALDSLMKLRDSS